MAGRHISNASVIRLNWSCFMTGRKEKRVIQIGVPLKNTLNLENLFLGGIRLL